ncbi:MAG: hypothetical protein ACRD2J_13700 [Thermoanaerobaculia bacterium]
MMKPVYRRMPRPTHDPEFLARARALSSALLAVHGAILAEVRREFESEYGPQTPTQLWNLLLQHHFFQWMRPLSVAVAQLDELLASETDRAPYRALTADLHHMLSSGDPAHPFAGTYARYLQTPEIVTAHAGARLALRRFEDVL